MPRDKDGNIVPQCDAQYIDGPNHVHCIKERGHDGDHIDVRGNWETTTMRTEKEASG